MKVSKEIGATVVVMLRSHRAHLGGKNHLKIKALQKVIVVIQFGFFWGGLVHFFCVSL